MLTDTRRQQRAKLAALSRHRPNDPETAQASRDFAAMRLEDYIRRVMDEAPPLTDGQRSRLAMQLLRGAGDLDGAA
jgi:hypothetical protein